MNAFIEHYDIEKLEQELAFWRPLGKKWLALKNLLADTPQSLVWNQNEELHLKE
ncbi:MAG: hypothetical protein ACRDFB_01540 [Rhabdochlamydiaceae bacterium]